MNEGKIILEKEKKKGVIVRCTTDLITIRDRSPGTAVKQERSNQFWSDQSTWGLDCSNFVPLGFDLASTVLPCVNWETS